MAELSDQKTPEEAFLYDLVNAANWTGSAWENSKQGKMLWLMYQKSKYFAEAIKLAETTQIPGESERSRKDRISRYRRNLNLLLTMEFSGSDEVGVERKVILEHEFDKTVIKDTSPEAQQKRRGMVSRLRRSFNQYEAREIKNGKTPLEFDEWIKTAKGFDAEKRAYRESLHYDRIVENRRVLMNRFQQSKKPGEKYKDWVSDEKNREEIVSDGLISQGGATELPIEQTPQGIIGGSLWAGTLSEYEFEYMKAHALQQVLQVWKDDIEGDGLETSGLSTKYRKTLRTIGEEESENKFIQKLQKRKYAVATNNAKFDKKEYDKWLKTNGYPKIPRTSETLAELNKKKLDAYKKRNTENRNESVKEIKSIESAIRAEKEAIRKEAAEIREKIFNDYAALERADVIDPEYKETNEAILSNLKKQFVEQEVTYSDTGGGINYSNAYRVRAEPPVDTFDEIFVYPKFRAGNYSFVGDTEALQNPDQVVKEYEGVHGEFKFKDLDRRHSLLNLYLKQSRRVFNALFDIFDEDGKKVKGAKQDEYGDTFEVPDRIRNQKGQYQEWNRVYTVREQLNETFLKSAAEEGDTVSFTGVDADGKRVKVKATFTEDTWVDKDGKELSHRMGTAPALTGKKVKG